MTIRLGLAGLAAAAVLTGCGGSEDQAVDSTQTSISTSAGDASSTSAKPKVSANTASESEITAALQAAGVANASQWAEEVVEYRPYDPADTSLAKLRQNLAKYNPDDETLDKIISTLQP